MQAPVINIQRMSTDDGPGIRTTVFFKGCPLACTWCHNPESIPLGPQTVWQSQACVACNTCADICENGALTDEDGRKNIDAQGCKACGACAAACPGGALIVLGEQWDVAGLVREVAKDRAFFEESGGGVTASGGEPAIRAGFVAEFFAACREQGLHTALDTCGACAAKDLQSLLPHSDLVLFDLKEIDSERHQAYTGQPNRRILDNARLVAEQLEPWQSLWIRTPLIPGATASDDNLRGLAAFIDSELCGRVDRWELLAFNNLAREQYQRSGTAWAFAQTPLMSAEQLKHFEQVARAASADPDRVVASGATRVE